MKANGLAKLVVGLLLIVASLYALFVWPKWWTDFLVMLKAGIPIVVFVVGLVFLLLSFEE